MPIKKRKPLDKPLPPVKAVDQPTPEQLDEYNSRFDALVPEWAGVLAPDGKRFERNDVTGQVSRVRDGRVVTNADKRNIMALFTERMRGQ